MEALDPVAQIHRPAVDLTRLTRIGYDLLEALGENPDRAGLVGTPERFARAWQEFIEYDPGKTDTLFESESHGQFVAVSPMRVWSYCEHHLLPFWCDVSIAYIPDEHVLGLSKFARIAHQFAHRLQIQERLVAEIAQEVQRVTGSADVMVMGQGVHLCMVIRGVQTSGVMTSLSTAGRFEDDAQLRAEFFRVVEAGRHAHG